ncbi:MAG: hypothetical protein JNM84_05755 [Planctomycetes bacterium]|nr:hypothetical protein [Planctomycetota bacterium]
MAAEIVHASEEPSRAPSEIDALLVRIAAGDESARGLLIRCLHDELHLIARQIMQGQRKDHTLQATALVGELYLRIGRKGCGRWNDREHFLAYASCAMRSVLTDHARRKNTGKRHSEREHLDLEQILVEYEGRAFDVLALEEALVKLEQMKPQIATAIVARFYGGATALEAAKLAGLSPRTFDRDWEFARKWLFKEVR